MQVDRQLQVTEIKNKVCLALRTPTNANDSCHGQTARPLAPRKIDSLVEN